ncbi:MAG: hypothetical protein ISQ09_13770 [Rubripirellula sp.]|nr:hypothetical protein [Rubripirellula sp.]
MLYWRQPSEQEVEADDLETLIHLWSEQPKVGQGLMTLPPAISPSDCRIYLIGLRFIGQPIGRASK